MPVSYYDILQIKRSATKDEIKKSFRTLALRYHPDKNKNIESKDKFLKIVEAYEILSDDNSRRKYDSTFETSTNTNIGSTWIPSADFNKYYSYNEIKNWYRKNSDFRGGMWDIGEKEHAGMWKTTLALFGSLASVALFIVILSK